MTENAATPVSGPRRGRGAVLAWTLPFAACLLSLCCGAYGLGWADFRDLLTGSGSETAAAVLWEIRLPRIAAGLLVGASLALAGAAFQGMFHNPLVSPDILGASAGAGFGASLAILMGWNMPGIQGLAFAAGVLAVALAAGIGARAHSDPTLGLILAGILVGMLFSAATALLRVLADPYSKLPAITFWLMGGLNAVIPADVGLVFAPMLAGAAGLLVLGWPINLLAQGEDEARALGLNTRRVRLAVICCATLLSASAVCIGGLVGWIGLITPHLGRTLVGSDHRRLFPACLALGGGFTVLVDTLARTVAPLEIPLGILTAFLGAPFFLYYMIRYKSGFAA